MDFRWQRHPEYEGKHSTLSASKYHWINYDLERATEMFANNIAAQKGTELHNFAAIAIKLGQKLQRSNRTLNAYVNDAIGFRMIPEMVLAYSPYAFGTADAVSFREKFLRIHDLKTGTGRTSMKQLYVYAAYFCLEYDFKPGEIGFEFRIYQNDQIFVESTSESENASKYPRVDRAEILRIMNKLVALDELYAELRAEAFS